MTQDTEDPRQLPPGVFSARRTLTLHDDTKLWKGWNIPQVFPSDARSVPDAMLIQIVFPGNLAEMPIRYAHVTARGHLDTLPFLSYSTPTPTHSSEPA